jgi:multidrug resistance efflux pump
LVKVGTVLFKIDPTSYEAQVRKIDAQLKFQELRLAQMNNCRQAAWPWHDLAGLSTSRRVASPNTMEGLALI